MSENVREPSRPRLRLLSGGGEDPPADTMEAAVAEMIDLLASQRSEANARLAEISERWGLPVDSIVAILRDRGVVP